MPWRSGRPHAVFGDVDNFFVGALDTCPAVSATAAKQAMADKNIARLLICSPPISEAPILIGNFASVYSLRWAAAKITIANLVRQPIHYAPECHRGRSYSAPKRESATKC